MPDRGEKGELFSGGSKCCICMEFSSGFHVALFRFAIYKLDMHACKAAVMSLCLMKGKSLP